MPCLDKKRGEKTNDVILVMWGYSSAGRAPALHAGGQQFDPA